MRTGGLGEAFCARISHEGAPSKPGLLGRGFCSSHRAGLDGKDVGCPRFASFVWTLTWVPANVTPGILHEPVASLSSSIRVPQLPSPREVEGPLSRTAFWARRSNHPITRSACEPTQRGPACSEAEPGLSISWLPHSELRNTNALGAPFYRRFCR